MDLSNISIRRVFDEGLVPLSDHQAPTVDSLSKNPFLASLFTAPAHFHDAVVDYYSG